MPELVEWLKLYGLEAIAPLLAENDIDLDILPALTDQDLERLGLTLGQRRRLLKAIASLLADPAAQFHATATVGSDGEGPVVGREAERRQVTVMFCDLVGSTELSGRLDPEDLSKLVRAYQDACAGAVARFSGFLAKLMGDGVLAYFGFPQAHEDSAEQAVRAAMAIVAATPRIATQNERLQVRIGIATGLVVVGDIVGTGVARELSIIGETPNLAARLQGLAEPGSILISETTRQLIGRTFEVENAGTHPVKGFAELVPAWRVRGESAVASRFAAARSAAQVPFIGREHEIGLLLDRWQLAKSEEGQVVLLVGEAGIGKSRLVETLNELSKEEARTALSLQGAPHYANTTLYPVIRYLELAAQFAPDDTSEQKLDKLENLLGGNRADVEEAVTCFADLLSLPAKGRGDEQAAMPPAQKMAATLNAFVAYVRQQAELARVLLVLEDAHWIDPTTVELITQLIDAIKTARVLVLITARPDFAAPWTGRPHATQINLTRLSRAQSAQMVAGIASASAIPPAAVDEIVAKTDGVPLFVEELTKAFLASGRTGERASVPATLQDSLMARLDRLGEAKEIAQIASVIGRQFAEALLTAVSPLGGADLEKAIARLVEGEIVFPQRQSNEVSYSFKHALTRDAAYESLLRTRRQSLHERIAKALEDHFPSVVAEQPELLAYHFAAAGRADLAASYRERAGDRAVAQSAYNEAVAHYSAALDETRKLPDLTRQELRLLLKLNPALSILKGAQSQEAGETARRAYEIAQTARDGPELFKATWNLWYGDNMGRRPAAALARAEELVALGQRLGDPDLLLEALHCRWSTALFGGNLAGAFKDSRDGVARYDPALHHKSGVTFGGHDPGVCAHVIHGMTLAIAGRFDMARDSIHAGVALAEQLGHPHTLSHAYVNAALTFQIVGDRGATSHACRRLIEISEKYKFPPQLAIGLFLSGWASAAGPDLPVGLNLMEAEFGRAASFIPFPNHFATMLAEVRLQAGQVPEAFQLIEQTIPAVSGPDIGFYLPHLLQLRRDCLARLTPPLADDKSGSLATATRFAELYNSNLLTLKAAALAEIAG